MQKNEWYIQRVDFQTSYQLYLFIVKMLDENYHLRMQSNRKYQKDLSRYSDVVMENFEVYQSINNAVVSKCDESGTKKETKSIVKKIYDTFALKNPQASPLDLEFAAVNCFRLGLKFNEDPQYHDQLSIEKWKNQVDPRYTTQDFIDFEVLFYSDPEYSMSFTTPYDYFGLYSSVFPMTVEHRKGTILMLDISFTIPELMFFSAEQIFFGCLLAAHNGTQIQKGWILSQTFFKQESLKVCQIVFNIYNEEVQADQNAKFQ